MYRRCEHFVEPTYQAISLQYLRQPLEEPSHAGTHDSVLSFEDIQFHRKSYQQSAQ